MSKRAFLLLCLISSVTCILFLKCSSGQDEGSSEEVNINRIKVERLKGIPTVVVFPFASRYLEEFKDMYKEKSKILDPREDHQGELNELKQYIVAHENSITSIREQISLEFANSGFYDVVLRDNLDKVLREQHFQMSDIAQQSVRVGKILGARAILIGEVTEIQYVQYGYDIIRNLTLSARMIDVEKGTVIHAGTYTVHYKEKNILHILDIAKEYGCPIGSAAQEAAHYLAQWFIPKG